MAEAADQIRSEIEAARLRLDYDLSALESRIKYEADWRVQFDRRPWPFVSAVFGLALLIGLALGHRRRPRFARAES